MNRSRWFVVVAAVLLEWRFVYGDCPNTCSGHGTCTTKGNGYFCSCYKGFTGGDCSRRLCPSGDDPLTGASTDSLFGFQKNEKQTVLCAATYETSFMYSSQMLAYFDDMVPSLPLLVGDSSLLMHAGIGMTPKLTISKPEVGSKENEACSNRGRCDLTSGVCSCYVGYTTSDGMGSPGDRGDCGATDSTIIACPVSKIIRTEQSSSPIANDAVVSRVKQLAAARGFALGRLSFAVSA
ncbi:hypothetical protein JG687_00006471 [Phytophthora cactorum]|uniref:EGF-like domain-containing protein n=1 Tax=Phytophthora cactorum TaxID=29920 RepID=A0A8T1UMJ2_9STRA|nr:hypothetical protein JG687_00006471 [Phytophthora cactorum]